MRVLYVFDALCGWCYGFGPVINKLHQNFSEQIEFAVVSGGMFTGSGTKSYGDLHRSETEAYVRIREITKVRFGRNFIHNTLKRGEAAFNSFPPSKALTVVRDLKPNAVIAFCDLLQKGIYNEGHDPTDIEWYPALAESIGVSRDDFKILWSSPDYDVRTKEDFVLARQLGVVEYPSLFLENEGSYQTLSQGYASYRVVAEKLHHFLD